MRVRVPAGFARAQQLGLAWAEGVDTLYKFRSYSGPFRRWLRQILKNSRIYFSTPSQFNDPFDVSPVVPTRPCCAEPRPTCPPSATKAAASDSRGGCSRYWTTRRSTLPPVGPEGDLRDLSVVGPFRGDQLGALVGRNHLKIRTIISASWSTPSTRSDRRMTP
jgi:hypothetical protein